MCLVRQGYPTIKHFRQGADGKKEVVDYNGGRVAADLVQFVETRLEQVGSVAPIPEIVKTVPAPPRRAQPRDSPLATARSPPPRDGVRPTSSRRRAARLPA
jgi:hypothetical protein